MNRAKAPNRHLTSSDSKVWSHHERMLCRPKRYSSIPAELCSSAAASAENAGGGEKSEATILPFAALALDQRAPGLGVLGVPADVLDGLLEAPAHGQNPAIGKAWA